MSVKCIFLLCCSWLIVLSVLLLSFFYSHTVWASGSLVGYWKFDETVAGSTAVDSSGAGDDGIPQNSPVPTTDVPSAITFSDPESISLNGTDQYIQVPDNDSETLTDATFSTWVKFDNVGGGDQDFLAKRNGSGVEYQFGKSGGQSLKVTFAVGGSNCCHDVNYSLSPALSNGQWYNFAVTINQTTHQLKWYVSGVLKQTDDITGYNLGTNTTANLSLGSSYDGTGEFLDGNLDEMRIYNRVLTDDEIAGLAEGDSGPDVATPTPSPTSDTQSPGLSAPSADVSSPFSCNNSDPSEIPDLFQLDSGGTYANLYFTTVRNSSGYTINYGLTSSANQYSDSFDYSGSQWTLGRTVSFLNPNTNYYFRIQARNGCAAGLWSPVKQVKTKNASANITQWFANLNPFKTNPAASIISTTANNNQTVLGATVAHPTSCTYTFKAGQSLWGIAQTELGSWKKIPDILSLNPGLDPKKMHDNQTIKLCS